LLLLPLLLLQYLGSMDLYNALFSRIAWSRDNALLSTLEIPVDPSSPGDTSPLALPRRFHCTCMLQADG
jgi:hypothetical protein